MPESFPFPTYSGLLTKDHRENIGPAIWEFLWCISKTTREEKHEDGENWGIVLGGKPVKHADIAEEIGSSERTVKRNMSRLKEYGYIQSLRAPYGEIISVRKSKKFSQKRSAKNGTSEREGPDLSHPDVPHLSGRSAKNGTSPDKNGTSNKDIIGDITRINNNAVVVEELGQNLSNSKSDKEGVPSTRQDAALAPPEADAVSEQGKISESQYRQAIRDKYITRRDQGLEVSINDEQAIDQLVKGRIPLRTVLEGIDKSFDEYKAKHDHDKIRSLQYCVPIIFDLHHLKRIRDSQKQDSVLDIAEKRANKAAKQGNQKKPLPKWVVDQMDRSHDSSAPAVPVIDQQQQKEADQLLVKLNEMDSHVYHQKWGEWP